MAQNEKLCSGLNRDCYFFRKAVTGNFKEIAESVSYDEFLKIFPVFKSKPSAGQNYYKKIVEELQKHMCSELDTMLEEGLVSESLSKLQKLVNEKTSMEISWRPPGNVQEHLRSYDAEAIKEETLRLQRELRDLENGNEKLKREVSERRRSIRSVEGDMDRLLHSSAIQKLQKNNEEFEKCIKILQRD